MEGKSGFWKHGLLLTLLFGFTVMLVGGAYMYKSRAPIPEAVVSPAGRVLFTAADVQSGQELFRRKNLMNYGSVLGHGAYFGPDYTADALHIMTETMRAQRSGGRYASLSVGEKAAIDAEVAAELKQNRYRAEDRSLVFTDGQAKGWDAVVTRHGRELAAFFTWTAWLSVANRPEAPHSYTNNWPYDKAAGNTATAGALVWSAASVALLLMFLAGILYVQHRWQLSP
jgi:nitric oxide reductase subunit B